MSPIVERIAQIAAQYPEKKALICGDVVLSYSELTQKIVSASSRHNSENDWTNTFASGPATLDQAVAGLARLAGGRPIVGSTSGSMGNARTYRRDQRSWIESFQAAHEAFQIDRKDTICAPGQLTHSLFSYALCHGLYVGATVMLFDLFRPDRVLRQCEQHRATVLYGVPTQLQLMTQLASPGPLTDMRWVLSSGARWFAQSLGALRQRFPHAQIAEFYGASETSFISLANHSRDSHLPQGSVGRPFPGVRIQIDAPDGRIWVSSPALFEGYQIRKIDDGHERLDETGTRWVCVGDRGRLDEKGYLFLLGREHRKIVTSGKNLYPEEVEGCLTACPGVVDALVVGVSDPLRGERLVAVLGLSGQEMSMPSGMRWLTPKEQGVYISQLKNLIDDYKIPRLYLLMSDRPLTPTGKVDFAALQRKVAQALSQRSETIQDQKEASNNS